MKAKRPINLDLTTMTFPSPAIASILHRISGVVLFLLFPWLIYTWSLSVQGISGFVSAQHFWQRPFNRLMLFIFAAGLVYHFIAGIRHLLMDLGLGESLQAGRRSARFIILLSVFLIVILGIKLW